jgi:solute carrier family 45 protein 1/2/4
VSLQRGRCVPQKVECASVSTRIHVLNDMTVPTIPDPGEDPTMQIPWPSAKSRHRPPQSGLPTQAEAVQSPEEGSKVPTSDPVKQRLTTWNLITLSISMAGAQVAWTVELGYDRACVMFLGCANGIHKVMGLRSCSSSGYLSS